MRKGAVLRRLEKNLLLPVRNDVLILIPLFLHAPRGHFFVIIE